MRNTVLSALVGAFAAFFLTTVLLFRFPIPSDDFQDVESAYSRVIKSGTLRCGYFLWPGFLDKDANTGKMSGFWVDVVETAMKAANLKVEWTAEVNLGQIGSELNAGRIDAICGPVTVTASRANQAYFARPLVYVNVYPYVRVGETRFDAGMESINSSDISISVLEGESSGTTARMLFPKARIHDVMTIAGEAGAMLDVVSGKADIVLRDPMTFAVFNKNNPHQLERLKSVGRLSVESGAFAVPFGDEHLRTLLDSASADMLNKGIVTGLRNSHGFTAEQLTIPTVAE